MSAGYTSFGVEAGIRMATRVGTLVVVVHAIVVIAHGVAHYDLGVGLNRFQTAYVAVVIVAAPIVAGGLLWTRRARFGLILLALSMAAALVFGIYWHYVAVSPDNVAHLPEGQLQGLFLLTALLQVLFEAIGVVVGLWGLKQRSS
jgi:hypothetical protein